MTWALVLGAALVALVAWGLVTAARPAVAPADREAYLDRWQQLHGGYDPRTRSTALRGWLTVVHALARPLARRGVAPDVVTVASVWLALAVVALSDAGGRWWVAAGLLLVLSGLADSLDGCVAVLQRRTTAWGYVLDSAVDRVTDAVYLVALVLAGCPLWLAAACGFACFELEYLRARAGNAGAGEVDVITVAERPTRVIVLAPTLALAGVLPGSADAVATAGVAVLLAMTALSVVQLGVVVRRKLLALPPEER